MSEQLSFGQPGWGSGLGSILTGAGTAATGGMNPLVLMSLIQGGGTLANTLFSGLLGGAGIDEQRRYDEGIWEQKKEELKPEQPFYMTPYLAGYDKILMKAVLSNLSNKGQGFEGLDMEAIMKMMGGAGGAQSQSLPAGRAGSGRFDNLSKRY
jgi:hypothetical protein